MKNFILLFAFLGLLAACGNRNKDAISIKTEAWGTYDNKEVMLYTIENSNGMKVKITNYGGIVTSILVPDKAGNIDDVVLGFDNLDQYTIENPCFGATIGRFANRIGNAQFKIADSVYTLSANKDGYCMHGGFKSFDKQVWDSEVFESEDEAGIKLHYLSVDGEEGFPGNLNVFVTYSLNQENELGIHFEAISDKPTHVNLTNHSYFNLTGVKENVLNHQIKIDADNFLGIDSDVLPTGEILSLKGKDWNLKEWTSIGENIHKLDHNGYHYCYVFNKAENEGGWVIEVMEPESHRKLDVFTTQPGVQFYTGNSIGDSYTGKYGIKYNNYDAFCLETQHFPDAPNHENFPSTLLLPNGKYDQRVIYKFSIY